MRRLMQMKGKANIALAIGLAALALIRPLMNMLGWLAAIGQPMASIMVTIIISIIWIAVAVRVDNPVLTLLYTGLFYGIFAIVISAVASPILTGQLQGPITNPWGFIGVLFTNAVWGLITGFIAAAIKKSRTQAGS